MERSCSTDKSLQKHNTFIFFFFFEKLLGFYKLLKSGGSRSFSVKENTRIKCICYINNMFSKKFINQTLKSYTSFNFIYTYSRYRFEIIKLWLYLPPKNYQISFKTTVTLYFNIEESKFFSKGSLPLFQDHFNYTFQKQPLKVFHMYWTSDKDAASFLEISQISS